MKQIMTLNEWEQIADRIAFEQRAYSLNYKWIPDTIKLQDSGMRALLWQLSDYSVLSVSGGTIWLIKRTK